MSIRDYREKREQFNEFKLMICDRERGHCQKCGKTDGLRVYFENEDAKNKLDPSRAVLLCSRCFDTAISVNRILQAQKDYADRKRK